MADSDYRKQEDIEKFIRQSLLGGELIDTQFHLFSSKSLSSGRIANPRVLAANDILLTKGSTFFAELLSLRTRPSDTSLVDIGGTDKVPQVIPIDDYIYTSDSDLDDDDAQTFGTDDGNPEPATQRTRAVVSHHNNSKTESVNDVDELSEADSEFVSDILELEPETSVPSSEPPVQPEKGEAFTPSTITHLSARSRHILVKDTAFQTWYTLLNYIYTGKVAFLPLKSAGAQSRTSSTSHIDVPRCSPKSMYRLACKVGLDDLRDEAMAAIRSGLTEHNVLTELAHNLVSSHPPLLDMELDVLYSHIASLSVVTGLPSLARRIANKELPHGANVIVGIHSRLLRQHLPLLPPASPLTPGRTAVPEPPQESPPEPLSESGSERVSLNPVDLPAPTPVLDSQLAAGHLVLGFPAVEPDTMGGEGGGKKKGKKGGGEGGVNRKKGKKRSSDSDGLDHQ